MSTNTMKQLPCLARKAFLLTMGIVSFLLFCGLWTEASAQQGIHGRCAAESDVLIAGGGDQNDSDFIPMPGLEVRVIRRFSRLPTDLVVYVTADANVEPGAEIRIGFKINNGPTLSFGPGNFANHQEFFETRTMFAIIPGGLCSNVCSIQASMRISGDPGKAGFVVGRCIRVNDVEPELR